MEQFKNLLQVMIWAHNRLDLTALASLRTDIKESYRNGSITSYEMETLEQARQICEMDCDAQLRKKEEAVNASMA